MTHPFQPGDRIFAYLRDSGHENQELSIAQQRRAIQEWADENGLIVTQWFIDEARPGSSVVGRDALQELMRQFRRGCPERGVIVWKYNRFARDIDNAQYYRAEIRSRGYEFASLNETIPEGPMGRVFEAIIDFKDEQFLLDLSTDVKRGLRNLVLTHGCVPGVPPRGLKRERVIIGTRRD
ncbi:recombinase family protein, partial [Candidatus Parcubacteria bacterium]